MTIGVWGDSTTFGSCDSEALGWVGRLQKTLSFDDYDHIYNFGICGQTSADLLLRFTIEAQAIRPAYVVFAIGINDSKYLGESDVSNVPLQDYQRNLEELIRQAKNFTEKITLISVTKVDDKWRSVSVNRFHNEVIQQYNSAMYEIAERHKLNFINVFDVLDTTSDLADGLHPNAQGYQKLFECIKNAQPFK